MNSRVRSASFGALLLALVMTLLLNAAGVQALAPLLDENFDYGGTAGDLTAVSGGNWNAHSGAGSYPVGYATTSLSMPSYASSGVGGSATFAGGGSREDVNRLFTEQTSGVLYYATLVNVSQASTTGDYFLHFKNSGTGFAARLFARDSSGALQFGIGTGGTPTYGTTTFAYNTTYLAVAKFDMAAGYSALHILDSCMSTEPGTPLAESTGGAFTSLLAIAIRQGTYVVVGTVDGIRVATTWAEAAQCVQSGPELSIAKSAAPNANVDYHGEVTYTVTLVNAGGTDDANTLLTDTLPAEVDFARWIDQPTGAAVSADEITWSGAVTAGTAMSFTFVVTHVGDYGDVVTNTAEFSGTVDASTVEAVFTVKELNADVTFVYHDLEDVVQAGDQLYLAGDFNSWSTTATPMTGDANDEVFTATVADLAVGTTYEYKYVVKSGGDQWNWLQTSNRSVTVAGTGALDDYRDVAVDWAILQWPPTLEAQAFQPTDLVYGRVHIPSVTDPSGEGRGIKAEVGYGDTATPVGWTWFPMSFNVDDWANDEFMGAMTPTASGVYSYAVRFDGNWGTGNPNADWAYGDLDGYVPSGDPFELDQTGVMTSTLYDVAIAKTCPPSPVLPGQTVRYTLSYDVPGGPVEGTVITDVLPADVTYVTDSSGVTPAQPVPGTLVWNLGTVSASGSFVVTGTMSADPTQYQLTNQVWVAATNDAPATNNSDSCTSLGTIPTGPIPIYDIQYTTDAGDGTYPSPLATQYVTTTGTVCSVLAKYFIITEAPGAWHSIIVYNGTNTKPAVGTRVQIRGTVTEYYGLTEFSYPTIISMGAGDPVCDVTGVDTAIAPYNNAGLSEPYESVLVEYPLITITQNTWTGRNTFTDSAAGTGKWGDWGYFPSPRPAVGTLYEFVRGPLAYTYDEYRVMPASAADAPLLDVTPPTVVAIDPLGGATGVNIYKPIYATFSEAIDPDTLNNTTFALTGPAGSVAGTVGYDGATYTASFVPAAALSPSSLYTATLTTGIADLTGNPLAAAYVWTFTTGGLDTTPPAIVAQFPVADATDATLSTNVVITFSEELDPSTVVESNFSLLGPYGLVPWDSLSYDSGLYEVALNPSGLLLPTTRYTVTVSADVTDWAGLPVPAGQRTWSFTTQAEPPMFSFSGDLHNHTSYSDGSGTPAEAFVMGRACGLEFMALTDHSYAIDDTEWVDILTQANTANVDGQFVTLRGFEYTQGGEGHANVYNSVRHAVRTDTGCAYCDYTPNLETGVTVDGFYHWLSITGTVALDGSGTLMQFNHPGWINFNDWKYHPEVEDIAQLEEVGNGWGSSYVFSWDEWTRSLDYGWQVGATNNTDNHSDQWGCIGPNRTGVVMAALTRSDLMDALRARRTFAAEDSNADLFFKANGYWMGSEIANTGQIAFHVWGSDPDGELTTLVQLYTANEQLIAEIQPNTADFDWSLNQTISAGVHYYFVLVVQADGDRIVSSPIWTQGVEDVRLTDLTIQPSLPTIYNPSLLSARVTNRGATAQTLTVNFQADGVSVGQVPVTVEPCTAGPCTDAYATISWQPVVTGPVTLVAVLEGVPAGDNLGDNSRELDLDVTDEHIPLVLIDTGHNNIGVDPHGISQFVDDMTLHGYNVLFNLNELTASDLSTQTVRLLILNAYGPDLLTTAETQAVADFVAAGGSVWLNSMSDYTGKVWWAYNLADRMNALVSAIETEAGEEIPIRFNDDEVLDGDDNNGYPWGILWHSFPVSNTTGVGMNVVQMQSWSDASLMDRSGQALTESDLGDNGFMMVLGDMDPGYGAYGEANRTHNTDAEGSGYPTNDAYIYLEGEYLPAGAGYDLTGDGGRLFFYGDSNDPFNVFAYVAGDGKQNELFNLEVVMWLMGEPLHKMTVAEARYDPELDDTPETLDRLVWVEGMVTAGYGEFFDVLYVQDNTGGITVFAPAGNASGAVESDFNRGDCVRVVGTVDVYQGDTEIQFFETEQVHVLEADCVYSPNLSLDGSMLMPLTTYSASQEINEGWLVVVTGTVTAKSGSDSVWLDDGSGPVRLFLDGYNGTWDDVQIGNRLMAAGMTSEDGAGSRIRIRNHGAHPLLPDDVRLLPAVVKEVTPEVDVPLGGVVTYTIVITNPNQSYAFPIEMTDALPVEVDFGGWVVQPAGASVIGDVVIWQGNLAAGGQVEMVFTATVGTDPALYGLTVTNTATFVSETAGNAASAAAFVIVEAPPSLAIVKDVAPEGDVILGSIVTFTITMVNSGEGQATGVVMTDILPVEVSFGGWVVQPAGAIQANDTVTWTGDIPSAPGQVALVFTATVGTDPAYVGRTVTNTATFVSGNAGTHSDDAAFTIVAVPVPDLSASTKVSAYPGQQVKPGDLVTYTITLNNAGDGDAATSVTDILGPYYTVYDAMDLTESPAGTLTWSGVVPAGQQVVLHFVVQVAGLGDLPVGITVLDNSMLINDGVHPAFQVSDLTPPSVRIYGIYMPLVARNY